MSDSFRTKNGAWVITVEAAARYRKRRGRRSSPTYGRDDTVLERRFENVVRFLKGRLIPPKSATPAALYFEEDPAFVNDRCTGAIAVRHRKPRAASYVTSMAASAACAAAIDVAATAATSSPVNRTLSRAIG